MSRENELVTITMTMTREEWVELVHAAGTKWEIVEHMENDHIVDTWRRTMERVYNRVQTAVEAQGIEC